jgi:hypothetical protein
MIDALCNSIAMSENGWTDDHLCVEWFRKTFIPQASIRNTSDARPILLIYDGHGSHDTSKLVELATQHNIILLCLPPHTTHKLQPLDVGVFGPFSTAFLQCCDEIVDETGEEMPWEDFVKEYVQVRNATFKPSTIKNAWKKSGNWPINPDVFQDDDYAPSTTTLTTASHVPDTFPTTLNVDNCPCCHRDMDNNGAFGDDKELDLDLSGNQGDESSDNDLDDNADQEVAPRNVANETLSASETTAGAVAAVSAICQPATHEVQHVVPVTHFHEPPQNLRHHSGLRHLRHKVHTLKAENKALHSHIATLEAHCTMAKSEIQDLKRKQVLKDNRATKQRKLNVNARCLTSEEGRRLAQEQEAEREAREQEKQEKQEQKQAKEAERQHKQDEQDPNEEFSGSLHSKSKDDLKDIACLLGLSMDGQKKDLLTRITNKFDNTPGLRTDAHYEGLFRAHRSRRRVTDENSPLLATEPSPQVSNITNSRVLPEPGPSHAFTFQPYFASILTSLQIPNHPNPPIYHG